MIYEGKPILKPNEHSLSFTHEKYSKLQLIHLGIKASEFPGFKRVTFYPGGQNIETAYVIFDNTDDLLCFKLSL